MSKLRYEARELAAILSVEAAGIAERVLARRVPNDEECFRLASAVARASVEQDVAALALGFDLIRALGEGLPGDSRWDDIRGRLWALEVICFAQQRMLGPFE